MTALKPIYSGNYAFSRIAGTGGIGTGLFFILEGDHTLGRNESRRGKIVQFNDYCKLHIIMHYISVLLGAGEEKGVEVCPIGVVGDDESGKRMLLEMQKVGMNMNSVRITSEAATLFSVCFQYPDSTGGNITTGGSASDMVTPMDVENYYRQFDDEDFTNDLVIAVPEVPLSTRIRLLKCARNRGQMTVASLLPGEASRFIELGGPRLTDLLSINFEEALAIAILHSDSRFGEANSKSDRLKIVRACVEHLKDFNPNMMVCITDGPRESYGYSAGRYEIVPPLPALAVGTGGAGDAFVAGVITGLCCRLPLLKGSDDEFFGQSPLQSAMELGTLLASYSVTSSHTIHPDATSITLLEYADRYGADYSDDFIKLFAFARESLN